MDFNVDLTQLKQLEKAFYKAPKLLEPVTANVLNSLAFASRKRYIKAIERQMIVRNKKFVHSSLRVQKTRSGPIEKQMAISGSINRQRFTGWKEQQFKRTPKTKRAVTTAGRRGSKRNIATSKARLKKANKFYKPDQFQGRNRYNRFLFMMRVLATRRGGEIIISQPLKIKRGVLQPGLYQFRGRKFKRLQTFDINKTKKIPWMSQTNQQLTFSTDIAKKYQDSMKRIVSRRK